MKKTVKRRKIVRKPAKRRKKTKFSDALKAFILVGVVVAVSALLSCAAIMIHSAINKDKDALSEIVLETRINSEEEKKEKVTEVVQPPVTVNIETIPAAETTKVTAAPSRRPPREEPVKPTSTLSPVPVQPQAPVITTVSAVITPKEPAENMGTLVFVIDDAGNNLRELEPFLNVSGPLTIAVLPGLPYSAQAAKRIREAGKEVILHQPMEAIGGQNPGPCAIYSGMGASEIRSILARNIAEVGPVKGINNHQGSKVTMDSEAMKTILSFCKENKLYFLDSRTTAETVVPAVAAQMGIKIAERNIFIDNEQNKDSMRRYISGGLLRAQRNGLAVMIGHTWSPDLAPLLNEEFVLLAEQGYTLKTVFDIIN
ncbi:MAG: divergent polysaccharide deacetylase family protein [Treponema sp.]|nr:divergent polysaccharide deacetylase family protein [Treponema sp.]